MGAVERAAGADRETLTVETVVTALLRLLTVIFSADSAVSFRTPLFWRPFLALGVGVGVIIGLDLDLAVLVLLFPPLPAASLACFCCFSRLKFATSSLIVSIDISVGGATK